TSAANKWGYVMQNCTIDNYVGSYTYEADGHFTLGRPWQGEPRNYWLNTTMKAKPSADGWSGMGTLTTHFYEYNSKDGSGNAIDLSTRKNPST
ncbi:pectin esterase, partial [Klebsiella pneumoniae]|nr:pectin esterase [Klebsiella pneumoniae]